MNMVDLLASVAIATGLTVAGIAIARKPERYVNFILKLRYIGRPPQRAVERYRNAYAVNGMAFGAAGVLLFIACAAWVGVVVLLVRNS